jgi:hypothetical protein
VLLCCRFAKFPCWTPSRCSPASVPTLRRPQPAFDPHSAFSLPPRRTSPLENRRVMKMRPLHILAAALPGTRAGFPNGRAPKTLPTSRRLRVAAMSPGGSPRQTSPTVWHEALGKPRHRYSPLQLCKPSPRFCCSLAEEVLQDLNESAPEPRRRFPCRCNVVSILKPAPEI